MAANETRAANYMRSEAATVFAGPVNIRAVVTLAPMKFLEGNGQKIRLHHEPFGLVARINALMNLPSTSGAIASTSMPCPDKNIRASSML